MIRFLKSLLPFGLKRKLKDNLGVPSLHWSLQNIKAKGFSPIRAIDIGAYEGEWTMDFLEVFPAAKILMIEGQAKKENRLQKVTEQYSNSSYSINILSALDNTAVVFNEDETNSAISNKAVTSATEWKNARALDALVKELDFGRPDFIKLDVQGHELEVLKGGRKTLSEAEFCLLEITLIDLGNGSPLIADVIEYMSKENFQLYDISQFMRRPFDKALYQIDALFVKKDSRYVNEKRWN